MPFLKDESDGVIRARQKFHYTYGSVWAGDSKTCLNCGRDGGRLSPPAHLWSFTCTHHLCPLLTPLFYNARRVRVDLPASNSSASLKQQQKRYFSAGCPVPRGSEDTAPRHKNASPCPCTPNATDLPTRSREPLGTPGRTSRLEMRVQTHPSRWRPQISACLVALKWKEEEKKTDNMNNAIGNLKTVFLTLACFYFLTSWFINPPFYSPLSCPQPHSIFRLCSFPLFSPPRSWVPTCLQKKDKMIKQDLGDLHPFTGQRLKANASQTQKKPKVWPRAGTRGSWTCWHVGIPLSNTTVWRWLKSLGPATRSRWTLRSNGRNLFDGHCLRDL